MDLKLKSIKYLVYALIFLAIFPYTSSVLSFTYPQTTTLSTTYKDILVVEKDGIIYAILVLVELKVLYILSLMRIR